jgi:hypothetical protein
MTDLNLDHNEKITDKEIKNMIQMQNLDLSWNKNISGINIEISLNISTQKIWNASDIFLIFKHSFYSYFFIK